MKKRLLIGTDNLLPRWDGIARALHEIIPLLAEKYTITVVGPGYKGDLRQYPGVEYIRFPVSRFLLGDYNPAWPSIKKLKEEIAKADFVWTQTLGPIGAMTLFLASAQKKPLFAYIHSIEWELFSKAPAVKGLARNVAYSLSKIYARFAYNKCTLLFVPSMEIGEFYSLEGIKTQKRVVRLGVNLDNFKPTEDKAEAKKKVGIDPTKFIIGFSGRIAREKDLLTLYRGYVRIKRKHPDIRLLVVGEGLPEIKKKLQKDSTVIMPGMINNTPDYLRAMDIFVLPSLTETSSLSTMEAMSCGIPVICTPVGALKSYVRSGNNGLFFPRKNPAALAHRIDLLYVNGHKRHEMGKNARKTALTNFSWQRTAKELEEVFDLF